MPLVDVVHAAVAEERTHHTPHDIDQPGTPQNDSFPRSRSEPHNLTTPRRIPQSPSSSIHDTPALRTGPPRSISYNYTLTHSPAILQNGDIPEHASGPEADEFPFLTRGDSVFRGALEFNSPEQREREKEIQERKEKKRESKFHDDSWNPMKWFHESPKEEKSGFDFDEKKDKDEGQPVNLTPATTSQGDTRNPAITVTEAEPTSALQRSFSHPPTKSVKGIRSPRWGRLRSLLPMVASSGRAMPGGQVAIAPQAVNITDELLVGGLAPLMLRLWFERDEKDRRRVPVLFHRLRIRISDSLHPMHGNKSVFRIECEYANGAGRWVVYRQLRDFISLHTHYTISNAYNRNVEAMPEFPRTSLPYFKFLKKESQEHRDGEVAHADFARMQREVLENYLIGLIRAVMFHPTANRLAGFLEINALAIALAQSGGFQSKAGYLRIDATGTKGGGFGRKSTRWSEKKQTRWCAVRESYLVVLEQPGELTIWDVFLLDPDFKIERPRRYYRKGLNLLHPSGEPSEKDAHGKEKTGVQQHEEPPQPQQHQSGFASAMGTITSRMSRIFHLGHHAQSTHGDANAAAGATAADGDAGPSHPRRVSTSSSASSGSSNLFSEPSRPPTPMLDPSTHTNPLKYPDEIGDNGEEDNNNNNNNNNTKKNKKKKRTGDVSKHTFYIENSQMRLKLFAHNERQMLQWITSLERVAASCHYTGNNRFDSFAPIRLNVAAQWLVDGRDYFWNLSRAILLAHETIYIHDWWLSPELEMRRPNKGKYRIDKLLERKAKEGVKIYIILYQEVSSRTTPTDSNYTKQRLNALHKNIMVQRSPSHFQTGTFYWAHHEKMCVIDQTIAFMGGLDICFGRWDTPQHVIVDDIEVGPETSEIWPGKDYSNPRISDFHTLHKPDEDMYDRTKIPRMPWHDVGMQVVGQPARDLCRHFIQRWNYLLRIKNHSRTMPFLLPPPEFKPGDLTAMGLTGTCEMQICRSAGPWSMGTPSRIEHSIQNAYLKAIQLSEHFVYIENQFFITSTVVSDIKIENRIGDALVHRIIRAHRDKTPWKCCIVIPLLPGFAFPVDHGDASALRIILECQNRTIGRGPNSIFSRIRKEGIDPDDYISVFSLRNWAKMRGDVLTTEQVYIHGKVCIVDDRLAIIGSANINERSQRGERDSELAAVIRDTDMIDGSMAGQPFKVGRFAHTLRVRLMREHIGVDVDALSEADYVTSDHVQSDDEQKVWDPDAEQEHGQEEGVTRIKKSKQKTPAGVLLHDVADGVQQAIHGTSEAGTGTATKVLAAAGLKSKGHDARSGDEALDEERMTYTRDGQKVPGFADAIVPTLEEKTVEEQRPPQSQTNGSPVRDKPQEDRQATTGGASDQARTLDGELFGAPADASKSPQSDDEPPHARSGVEDADDQERGAPGVRATLRKHLQAKLGSKTWTLPTPRPEVDPEGFEDPISDAFWKNVWVACAAHNTEIYRKVFHAVPDDLVTTWKQYKEFVAHHDRLNKPTKDQGNSEPLARIPSEIADDNIPGKRDDSKHDSVSKASGEHFQEALDCRQEGQATSGSVTPNKDSSTGERRSARGPEPFEKWEREEMEQLLGELCGHLVMYPTRFLEGEDVANNFLFNADRLLPLLIYN